MDTSRTRSVLARIIGDAIEDAGLSIARVAEKTGIPYATLYRKLHAGSDFTFAELSAIASVVGGDVVAWAGEAQTAAEDTTAEKAAA
jgi:predicted transcriptional regulator